MTWPQRLPASERVPVPGFQVRLEEWEDCPGCHGGLQSRGEECSNDHCVDGRCECDCGDEHDCQQCDGAGDVRCGVCNGTGNVVNRCFTYRDESDRELPPRTSVYGCGGRGMVIVREMAGPRLVRCERCKAVPA
jgi:hypothetical protein